MTTSNNPPLQWLPPLVYSVHPVIDAEDDADPDVALAVELAEDTDTPPEQVLLADALEDSDHEDDEPELHKPDITLHWNVPEVSVSLVVSHPV